MCDLTHLSSAISPVATTYRCSRPVWGHGNYSRAVMTRTPPRWPAFREHLERASSESELMTHRTLIVSHRFNANTANTQAICKNAFYVGWWVKAGSTQLLSLRACLYINRHESCSASVSWKVCAAAYEHRRGVKFKDAFAFWFAAVPSEQLLTAPALHMHTHFKSQF